MILKSGLAPDTESKTIWLETQSSLIRFLQILVAHHSSKRLKWTVQILELDQTNLVQEDAHRRTGVIYIQILCSSKNSCSSIFSWYCHSLYMSMKFGKSDIEYVAIVTGKSDIEYVAIVAIKYFLSSAGIVTHCTCLWNLVNRILNILFLLLLSIIFYSYYIF